MLSAAITLEATDSERRNSTWLPIASRSYLSRSAAAVVVRVIPTTGTTQVCDFENCDDATVTELKTVTVVDVAEGETATVSTPVSVLSTIATEVFEAETDGEEAGLDAADAATLENLLDTVSETVVTILNIDSDVDLFDLEVASATSDVIEGTDLTDEEKSLSLLNASLGSIEDADGTTTPDIAASITAVVTAIETGTVDAANDIITAVNAQTAANVTSEAITVPDTVDTSSDAVTEDDLADLPDIPDVSDDGTTGASSGAGTL